MSHYEDCPLSQPCPVEWRRADLIDDTHPHRIVSGSSGNCVECDVGSCCCDELLSFGQRIKEAVAAIPLFDRFALGRRFRSDALAAIDRIIEERP